MGKACHGSCHCGAVRYRATLDLVAGTGRCNCTYCSKARSWSARATDFELLDGAGMLGDYAKAWDGGDIHHRFCRRCGIGLYGHGFIAGAGGAFVSVQVNTLDDASIDERVSGPVRHADGLRDDWMNTPADTRAM